MKRRTILLAATALALACGRGVVIESEPGPVYMISVRNPMSHPMDVWYDDGLELHELGAVDAQSTREFVIASPEGPSVRLIARDEGRTHSVTRDLELRRGSTATVVLTP